MFDFNNLIIINIMKKILLTSAVLLALLSSCNNDYDGPDIAGSKLIVSGNIDQVNTRVSDTGTEWTVDDAIGVSDNLPATSNLNIKYVTGSTTGDFTSATGIYILGSEPVTYTAYYPYKGEEGTSAGEVEFSIVDEYGMYVGSSAIDFMFAEEATASRAEPKVNFTFKHVMSKLKLNFKGGDTPQTKANTPISYILRGITTDGKFNTVDGTITPGTTKGNVKVETTLGSVSSVILPPSASSGEPSEPIQLVITVDDKVYSGSFTPGLAASQEYEYEIDLNKTESGTSLQISSPTINGWTSNNGGNINVNEEINLNPTLEIGDFLCNDGTTIDKEATLDADMKTKIIGVVYYVGNPQPSVLYDGTYTSENDILLTDYPNCKNGLAISLTEVSSSAFAEAETSDYCLHLWFNENKPTGIYPAGYTVSDGQYEGNSSGRNNFLGYNNTSLWEGLAEAKTLTIKALTELETFQAAHATTNTSTWYIPSSGELIPLVDYSTGTYKIIDALAASLIKADGAEIIGSYWTSTDGRLNSNVAQIMILNTKIGTTGVDKAVAPSPANATKTYKLRFAVAF